MSTRTVLIVGDDAAAAAEVERQLLGLGWETSSIRPLDVQAVIDSGRAAPDLVLVDTAAGPLLDSGHLDALRGRWNMPVIALPSAPFTGRELAARMELALCRHAAADAVRETEDRFFATSIDMLCFLGFDGHFRRLNPAWERTLGYTREELMSRPFIEFVHPEDRERTLAQNERVRRGEQALGFENRYRCRDGSYRWLHWNAAPDPGGGLIYSVARDVTERRLADEERERLVRELQAALAEVRTLRTILPICSSCRKIRDDENYWHTVEAYLSRHTTTRFSHGICPACMASVVEPQMAEGADDP